MGPEADDVDYEEYLSSEAWRRRARACYRRAGHRCELCNSKGPLHAHHRTYARFGQELVSDLTALCCKCHETFHDVHRVRGDSQHGAVARVQPDGSYVEYEEPLRSRSRRMEPVGHTLTSHRHHQRIEKLKRALRRQEPGGQ